MMTISVIGTKVLTGNTAVMVIVALVRAILAKGNYVLSCNLLWLARQSFVNIKQLN